MPKTLLLVAAAALVSAAGCQPAIDLPDGFVAVDQDGLHHTRAVSADGVVVGLRTHQNPKSGTLEFWSQAVENHLTDSKGYKLTNSEEITSTAGRPGRLMTFSAVQSGADFTYMLAIYVPGEKVVISEAGGRAAAVKAKADAIKQALLSVK